MALEIVTRYNYEARKKFAHRLSFDPKKDKSLTNQADLPGTDINAIMKRAENGLIDPSILVNRKAIFADFSEIGDYHSMLCAVRRAEEVFNKLPAEDRLRFNNDPQALIDFLADSNNDKEAVKLGLKDAEVLKTALADDGITRITPEVRAHLDAVKAGTLKPSGEVKPVQPPTGEGA